MSWVQIIHDDQESNVPLARSSHSLTYHSARGVVVLFGGQSDTNQRLSDIWEYDGLS